MRQALRCRKPDAGKPGVARPSPRDTLGEGGRRTRLAVLAATFGPYAALTLSQEGAASPVPYLFGLGMCWLLSNVLVDGVAKVARTFRTDPADTPDGR